MREHRLIRAALVLALVAAFPLVALAQTEIDWGSEEPLTGTVVGEELAVEVDGGGVYPLLVIESPEVGPPQFQVDGTVRYEDVAGIAYLEMWTVLPDESRYFTRTLAESGPLGHMTGSSDLRPFSLPFVLGEGGPVPTRLEINLVTEGSGGFWIGPLTVSASGVEQTTTSTTQGSTTSTGQVTTAAPPTTTAATDDVSGEGETGTTGLWWVLGGVVLAGGVALAWLRAARRRRAEEQRRMNAMDSLRS
jgi:hypothetical protein